MATGAVGAWSCFAAKVFENLPTVRQAIWNGFSFAIGKRNKVRLLLCMYSLKMAPVRADCNPHCSAKLSGGETDLRFAAKVFENLPTVRQAIWNGFSFAIGKRNKVRLLLCMYSLKMAPVRADCNPHCSAKLSGGETDLRDADVERVAEEHFLVPWAACYLVPS